MRLKLIINISLIALFLMYFTLSPSMAEEGQIIKPITLSEAFAIADKENLDLISAKKNVDAAKQDINIAKEIPNPQIQPMIGFGRVFAEQANPNQIGLNQLIEIGKRGPRTNVAKSNYNLANDTVKSSAFDLHASIRQAYIDLVNAKSTLVILNEQKILLDRLVDIAQKRYNAGDVAQIDVLEAQLSLNQVIAQINQAKSQVLQSRNAFNGVLNSKSLKNIVYDVNEIFLPGDFNYQSLVAVNPPKAQSSTDKIQTVSNKKFNLKINKDIVDPALSPTPLSILPPLEKLQAIALNQRLDLKIAKDQIDSAQKSLIMAKRQRIPDIDMSVGYMYDFADNGVGGKNYEQGVFIQPGITLPVFNQQHAEILKSKIALEQSKIQFESAKNQAFNKIQTAYEQLEVSRDNLLLYKSKLLQDSSSVVMMAQRRYEVGKADVSSVILAHQEYQSIMSNYVSSLISYYEAWSEMMKEVGEENYE